MTRRIIYDVASASFVDTDKFGLSGGISFDRLAKLLQETQCRGSERLTTIVIEPDNHMISLRFVEGERT